MQSDGLLVVRRINWVVEYAWVRAPERKASISASREEVLDRYRGVDGDPWMIASGDPPFPLQDGLAPLRYFEQVVAYYPELLQRGRCDLVFVQRSPGPPQAAGLPASFTFCGYDGGYYVGERAVFSVILHEVIYGYHAPLRAFGAALNDSLLFPSREAVDRYHRAREAVQAAGGNVETGFPFSPLAIFAEPRGQAQPEA